MHTKEKLVSKRSCWSKTVNAHQINKQTSPTCSNCSGNGCFVGAHWTSVDMRYGGKGICPISPPLPDHLHLRGRSIKISWYTQKKGAKPPVFTLNRGVATWSGFTDKTTRTLKECFGNRDNKIIRSCTSSPFSNQSISSNLMITGSVKGKRRYLGKTSLLKPQLYVGDREAKNKAKPLRF